MNQMSNPATQRPPAREPTPGRKLSDAIPMEAVQRIAKLPVVESSLNLANDVYSRVKESSSMMNWALSTAESTVSKGVEHAIPVAEKMEKTLKRVDSLLCSSLDYVEAKVPAVKMEPHEIYESTSKLVESKLQPALERATELKQMGAEKMHMDQLMAMVGQAWLLLRPAQAPPEVDLPSTPQSQCSSSPSTDTSQQGSPQCPRAPPPTPASGTPIGTPVASQRPTTATTEYFSPVPSDVESCEEVILNHTPSTFMSCEVTDAEAT